MVAPLAASSVEVVGDPGGSGSSLRPMELVPWQVPSRSSVCEGIGESPGSLYNFLLEQREAFVGWIGRQRDASLVAPLTKFYDDIVNQLSAKSSTFRRGVLRVAEHEEELDSSCWELRRERIVLDMEYDTSLKICLRQLEHLRKDYKGLKARSALTESVLREEVKILKGPLESTEGYFHRTVERASKLSAELTRE